MRIAASRPPGNIQLGGANYQLSVSDNPDNIDLIFHEYFHSGDGASGENIDCYGEYVYGGYGYDVESAPVNRAQYSHTRPELRHQDDNAGDGGQKIAADQPCASDGSCRFSVLDNIDLIPRVCFDDGYYDKYGYDDKSAPVNCAQCSHMRPELRHQDDNAADEGQNIAADKKCRKNKAVLDKRKLREIKELIGRMPDAQIARLHDVDFSTIYRLRKSEDVPSYRKHKKYNQKKYLSNEQKAEILPRLGKDTDAQIAREYDVSSTTILNLRKKEGKSSVIKHKKHKQSKYLTEEQKAEILPHLGKDTDAQIARKYGVCEPTILNLRKKEGKSSVINHKKHKQSKYLTEEQKAEILPRLGKDTYAQIAREYDVSSTTIKNLRVNKKYKPNGTDLIITSDTS